MKRHLFGIFVLVLIASGVTCAQGRTQVKTAGKSLPVFPYEQGWFGSDNGYSIPLTATRSLWLFGDPFVADADATHRNKYKTMIRNSIGISTCEPGKECTMRYYWEGKGTAKARSFFDTGTDEEWLWPMDGYRDGNALYMSAMVLRNRKGAGPEEVFGFEVAGTRWFAIENVLAPPEQWKMRSEELTGEELLPGSSTFADGKYVMTYALIGDGKDKSYMSVLRVARGKIAELRSNWEYLGADERWHAGTPKGDAKRVIEQPISEMSVRYHPSIKKWVAISGGLTFPTKHILARTADSATGPWSEPRIIFEFPEMNPKNPGYDNDTFCAATKEHVEFEHENLVITYACNSMSVGKVVENMTLYRPQVVVLDLPR